MWAVNHIDEWNPNYVIKNRTVDFAPLKNPEELSAEEADKLFKQLDINEPFRENNVFYPSEETIQIIAIRN